MKIALSSCNVTSAQARDKQGCLRLRVRAERRGKKSTEVEACSDNGEEVERMCAAFSEVKSRLCFKVLTDVTTV